MIDLNVNLFDKVKKKHLKEVNIYKDLLDKMLSKPEGVQILELKHRNFVLEKENNQLTT